MIFPSYRNQSVGLPCKSADWFLYFYMMGTLVVQELILGTLCPVVRKSDFSCSLEPPEINISGDYTDFFVLQKKVIVISLSVLIL